MELCHALEELRTEYEESDDVALIQRSGKRLLVDEEKVEVSYRQVYQWQRELRDVLCLDGGADEWVVAINLKPFSIEETATMLLVAEQRHWTYVPVDIQLSVARQLALLQSAGVRRLVTTAGSGLVKALVADEDHKMATIKSWTVGSKMSPFLSVQVVALPSNYFQAEVNLRWQRLRDCEEFVAPLYVLFTSGTTGKAKGVLGTRKGAWTRLEWMWKTYSFISSDAGTRTSERVLRATKLLFVDSVWEILGAFLQRVPLVHRQCPRHQVDDNGHSCMTSVVLDNSRRFLEMIRSENVTRFTAVPSVLEVLLLQTTEIDRQSCLAGLRYVLSSGESLSLHVLQQLTASLPDVTVLNLYGSTEVSGDITCMELKALFSTVEMAEWQEYGIPIASLDRCGVIGGDETSLLLLPEGVEESALRSSDDSPTVVWPRTNTRESKVSTEIDEPKITGVLYVSGPLVTHGYFSDVHGDVFVCLHSLLRGSNENNDKISVQPKRWFCTGDTCSVIHGRLYFCGRMDNAVKIHGQRVYMEVVERAVASALKETTRDPRFDHQGQVHAFALTKKATKHSFFQTCIVACIIYDDDVSSSALARYSPTKAFDAWIAESYGTSHIPHNVLMMPTKAVPRPAHGKIDRRALETLIKQYIDDCNVSLPRPCINSKVKSTSEKVVARLLNEILDIPLSDDVFDFNRPRTFREVGGNSLLATLFVHELRQELDELSLTAQDLLETKIEDILLACTASFLAQEHSCKKKKEESSLPCQKCTAISSLVRKDASDTAGELKRQKKTHHAPSGDNVGNARDSTQQSRLTVVSRYNQSSASVNGHYLPMCYTSPLSYAKKTVPASSSCLPWELKRMWQVDLGKCIDASPIVVQHRDHKGAVCSTWAIIGSHSAQLVCVDVMAAGQEIWRVTLDDRVEACAAISVRHELVYVGTYAGSLFALSLQSGVTRWKFHAKGIIKASSLVMDSQQLVVCGAYDNMLYGLDTLTGQQRWAIDLDGSIFSTPLYCAWSGQLFSATTNGIVVALRSSSKFYCVDEQWKLQLPAPVFAGINADYTSKMLIIGCADGQLYGVSMSTGSFQWQVSTEKPVFSSPCVYRPGSIVFGSHDGMLRKVDCQSGKLAWTTDLGSAVFASPTVVRLASRTTNQSESNDDGRLLCCVTTTAGGLYFCDERTGSIVYQTCESSGKAMRESSSEQCSADLGPLFGSPVLIENWCLLGTRTNQFYGFELVSRNSGANLARPNGKPTAEPDEDIAAPSTS